ncbi:MAG: N-acetyltransferase [Treponema sp.]|nr:N-acetyltransferase [Treponema sp.]
MAYKIRDVQPDDADELARIYSPYVLNTAVSFEYEAPSADEFKERKARITERYPFIVCEKDGILTGYAYAHAYGPRKAFSWTVETSIYVDRKCRRQGVGSMLYKELEDRLREQGIVNLLAGVAFCDAEDEYLSHDSYKFHLREGYVKVAHMKTVGKKFDRWYDLIWLQKKIG